MRATPARIGTISVGYGNDLPDVEVVRRMPGELSGPTSGRLPIGDIS